MDDFPAYIILSADLYAMHAIGIGANVPPLFIIALAALNLITAYWLVSNKST